MYIHLYIYICIVAYIDLFGGLLQLWAPMILGHIHSLGS